MVNVNDSTVCRLVGIRPMSVPVASSVIVSLAMV